jgi:hypothetical protein
MSPAASRATTDLRIHAAHTSGDFRAFYDGVCTRDDGASTSRKCYRRRHNESVLRTSRAGAAPGRCFRLRQRSAGHDIAAPSRPSTARRTKSAVPEPQLRSTPQHGDSRRGISAPLRCVLDGRSREIECSPACRGNAGLSCRSCCARTIRARRVGRSESQALRRQM